MNTNLNHIEPRAQALGMNSEQYREYLAWRILIQVVGIQFNSFQKATGEEDRNTWKTRLLETAERASNLTKRFPPQELPRDIPNPVPSASPAPNAPVEYWLEGMIRGLIEQHIPVMFADTSKIEISS